MKITLLVVGKTNQAWLEEAIAEYVKRLKRYISFEMKVIPDVKNAKSLSEDQLKSKEGELLLASLSEGEELFLFDERGATFSSQEFSVFLEKKMLSSLKSLVFVVGGAYGFSQEVYGRAAGTISLSRMTFSHQMVRVLIVEQLYRAFTILKGEPYHHS